MNTGVKSKVAIVGLDGVTYRILDPLWRAGVMPAFDKLTRRGTKTILSSTVPTYTPPAWVSMATGTNPGRHGIYGFLANTPQEDTRIAHAGLIAEPPMWGYLDRMEVPSGVMNVPMYFPPTSSKGFMIAGGLAAGWTDPETANFTTDEETEALVKDAAGGTYPLDTVVSYENDWNSPRITDEITRIQKLRRKVMNALLDRHEVELLFPVFEGPDRLQHLHYQYLVEGAEWYEKPEAQQRRDKAYEFFAEIDNAIADIVDWAGPDGHVLVVSDHGFGPWEKTLNVNLLLSKWGYLSLPGVTKVTRSRVVAGMGQSLARRIVPRRLLHRVKARVVKGVDWERTQAFSSHVAEQGIHVNVRGELPRGTVEPADAPALAHELTERLLELTDPDDGKPVVDHVARRADVLHGPLEARAPHLFPFCRDQRYELSDTLAATSPFTDHRNRPWGYHHKDGILVAAGPSIASSGNAAAIQIVDILPTAFHLAGLPVPKGLDGRVAAEILTGEAGDREVRTTDMTVELERSEANPYSAEEEAQIEESLRGLGYVE